jgi:hypothetical protein
VETLEAVTTQAGTSLTSSFFAAWVAKLDDYRGLHNRLVVVSPLLLPQRVALRGEGANLSLPYNVLFAGVWESWD